MMLGVYERFEAVAQRVIPDYKLTTPPLTLDVKNVQTSLTDKAIPDSRLKCESITTLHYCWSSPNS